MKCFKLYVERWNVGPLFCDVKGIKCITAESLEEAKQLIKEAYPDAKVIEEV